MGERWYAATVEFPPRIAQADTGPSETRGFGEDDDDHRLARSDSVAVQSHVRSLPLRAHPRGRVPGVSPRVLHPRLATPGVGLLHRVEPDPVRVCALLLPEVFLLGVDWGSGGTRWGGATGRSWFGRAPRVRSSYIALSPLRGTRGEN